MNEDFWKRCLDAECVVAAVRLYNEDGGACLGMRYAVFHFDNEAVGPHYYIALDEGQTGIQNLYNSPEDALRAAEQRYGVNHE